MWYRIALLSALALVGHAFAQPQSTTEIVLQDGTICQHAGFGATLAFDGQRLNYTCGGPELGILGDPVFTGEVATLELVRLSLGSGPATVSRRETVALTFGHVELEDGTRCAFAGRGATLAFEGRRLNYTCGNDQIGLIGEFEFADGAVHATRVHLVQTSAGIQVEREERVFVTWLDAGGK